MDEIDYKIVIGILVIISMLGLFGLFIYELTHYYCINIEYNLRIMP
jgi:hypothetical protein